MNENQLTSFVGKSITGFAMRLQTGGSIGASSWPVSSFSCETYDVFLSGSVAPADRSLTFANNVVGAQIQVRSGPLDVPVGSFPPGATLEFGYEVAFSTNYLYSGGHLLLEIIKTANTAGSSAGVQALVTSTTGYGTDFSACWATSPTATVASSGGNFCIVRLRSESASTMPISGDVELSNFVSALNGETIQMTLTNAGSPIAVHSDEVVLNAAGEYVYNVPQTLPLGNYDLYADGSPFVKRKMTLALTGSGAAGVNFSLPNGDCDDSGEVDATDIDLVISKFGLIAGMAGYSRSVDCDGSDEVDATDIDIVISSFGSVDD